MWGVKSPQARWNPPRTPGLKPGKKDEFLELVWAVDPAGGTSGQPSLNWEWPILACSRTDIFILSDRLPITL